MLKFGIWGQRASWVLQSLIRARIMLEEKWWQRYVLIQDWQCRNSQHYYTISNHVINITVSVDAVTHTCTNKWKSRAGGNPVWSWPPSCGTWADPGCGSQWGQTRPYFPSEPSRTCRDNRDKQRVNPAAWHHMNSVFLPTTTRAVQYGYNLGSIPINVPGCYRQVEEEDEPVHGDQHQHSGETLANHLWNYPLNTQHIKHIYIKNRAYRSEY